MSTAFAALVGGRIGPFGDPRGDSGDVAGTRVLPGAGDPDPHVPRTRVRDGTAALARLGAAVELRRRPGVGQTRSLATRSTAFVA